MVEQEAQSSILKNLGQYVFKKKRRTYNVFVTLNTD